jgi:hypothetical protein
MGRSIGRQRGKRITILGTVRQDREVAGRAVADQLRLLAGKAEDVDVAGNFVECRLVACLVDVAGGGCPDFAGEDGAVVAEFCGEEIEMNG